MRLIFAPQRRDDSLTLARQGGALTVNGETFDFSPLPDGALLPAEAIASEWFSGPVERADGRLTIRLVLPLGPEPSEAQAFPEPLDVTADGPVELPQ